MALASFGRDSRVRAFPLFAGGLALAVAAAFAGFLYLPASRPSRLPSVEALRSGGGVEGRARNTVVIVLDGARRAEFEALAATRPALAALGQRAARFEGTAGHPSISRPMYATLGSGASPRLHGVTGNAHKGKLRMRTLIDEARARGLTTLVRDDRTTFWWDLLASPPTERVVRIDTLIERLRAAPRAFAVVHVLDADDAAHRHGAVSDAYQEALRRDVDVVEQIAVAMDLERDVLVVTADHGHRDRGGHGGPEREVVAVPLWIVGRGARAGAIGPARAVDVAATVAVLLGLPLPAHGEGRPLFEGLQLAAGAEDAWAQVWLSQRWRLTSSLLTGLGEGALPPPQIPRGELALRTASAVVETYEGRIEAAYARRDQQDMRWRSLGVAPLFLGAMIWLFRRRTLARTLFWALVPMVLMYALWAAVLPFSLSAVRVKWEFYLLLALFASLASDLGALGAWLHWRRTRVPGGMRDIGLVTLVFTLLELAALFAWHGLSIGHGLPSPEGFFLPVLVLSRLAVIGVLWGGILPWLGRRAQAR